MNVPPTKLKESHKLAALGVALGWKMVRTARAAGMHPNRLSTLKNAPAFKLLVEQYQREFITKGMTATVDKLLADGPANVDFIRDVRDGVEADARAIEAPEDRLRLKLHAAGMLLDRQAPRKLEATQDTRIHFVVEGRVRTLAEDACAEAGEPIDVTPLPDAPLALPAPAKRLVPRPLDDVIREYEEQEAVGE